MPEQFHIPDFLPGSFNGKISNVSQIGGIETSVLDNGAGRGTRIAWMNTGSGLRYKIVIDRAMDIADAFFNQYSIAWLSRTGVTAPEPFSDSGIGWLRTFGGGLLTTCGLSHVGGPEKDEHGERGLHGMISNSPATIESIIQPDILQGKMEMSITGRIPEMRIFGPALELRRTISSLIGQSWLSIHDEVTNRGNEPAPHMLLYHFNFGWPMVDEGAELLFNGDMHLLNEARDAEYFRGNYRICPPPLDIHRGAGEAVACFDIPEDAGGICHCGIHHKKINLAAELTFRKDELPWMTNWHHWAPGEYVTGLEPGTHPPVGQSRARKEKTLIYIQPGETKKYKVKLQIHRTGEEIGAFLNRI